MVFDFALLLVILTLPHWGHLGPRRMGYCGPGARHRHRTGRWSEYGRSFFPVILLVLLIRSFLYEPFRIPSDSMMPTLLDGDFIFVSKFAYGLRLPVLNTRIVELGSPQRGDVVVFRQAFRSLDQLHQAPHRAAG